MLDAGHTLDEISAHLKALGADVSRTGIWRYKQQVDKVAARLRESRAMADAIMERMGAEAATGRSGDALIQMLTTLTSDYMLRRLDNPDAELEIDELRSLARAVKERAQAARATQDYGQGARGRATGRGAAYARGPGKGRQGSGKRRGAPGHEPRGRFPAHPGHLSRGSVICRCAHESGGIFPL